jgi:Ca2+-transporting ATPase
VSAPFGVALGLDIQTPGLMARRPRPSGESIVSTGVKLSAGLVGLYMAACLVALIYFGEQQYHSKLLGSSIALSAFGLMLIVAAFQSRSVSGSALVRDSFDNANMNWTAAIELVLAVMITQMDLFNRLLRTEPLTAPQFGLAVAAAVGLFGLWEAGKLIARRQATPSAHPQ